MCMELRQCWADDNHEVSGATEHFNPADALRVPLISGVRPIDAAHLRYVDPVHPRSSSRQDQARLIAVAGSLI